jgi:hypothetical protein
MVKKSWIFYKIPIKCIGEKSVIDILVNHGVDNFDVYYLGQPDNYARYKVNAKALDKLSVIDILSEELPCRDSDIKIFKGETHGY